MKSEEDLSFKVFGTNGAIFLKNWRELWISKENMNMEKLEIQEENHLVDLLNNVFKSIDGETSNIVDFYEGYKTHRVIEKLLKNDLKDNLDISNRKRIKIQGHMPLDLFLLHYFLNKFICLLALFL